MIERVALLCLHTSPLDQPGAGSSGGMNVYVRELARALATAGIEVDVFTRSADRVRSVTDMPDVRVVAVPIGPPGPLAKNALAMLASEGAATIAQLAAAERRGYDLIHSHYWVSGLAGARLAEHWSIPLVHMFHTLSRVKTRFAGSPCDPQRALGEQRVLDLADAVVVANQVEHRDVRQLYRVRDTRLVTIPCGIDPRPFEQRRGLRDDGAARATDAFTIVALGRAERLKNFALLLKAVARAAAREARFAQRVTVRLAGGAASDEPETLAELQQLARTLGMADRVQFLGPVPHAQVPDLYAAADVCVIPSRYESFGLVALEAMAAGVPVVATRVGGLAVSVEDGVNGILVEPDDVEALAERLLTLWADPALRAALGARGVISAHQYAWPTVAERMRCLYESLTAGAAELGTASA
jgi:D-inositol-3-phosphate glycosyltransferase